ncbi:MAG: PIG-L family deacetylase, partial [Candidatus Hodarchaeales archaeon]
VVNDGDSMNDTELDIIAVAAHPDDVELGCSGFLINLAKAGYKIGIIDLTDGEPTPFNENPEVRITEAMRSAEIIGCTKRIILDLPNRKLLDSIEARIKLAREFRKYKPKIVVVHYGPTPLASPDHYQAQLITDAAIFYSQLSKWSKHFDKLLPHKIYGQLYFTTGREVIHPSEKLHAFYEDISESWGTKVRAIRAYESQFKANPRAEGVIEWIEALNRFYGHEINVTHAERLLSLKPVQLKPITQFF